jgi:DNA polymerase-3 subunit delta'
MNTLIPTQLFIGNENLLHKKTTALLLQTFCMTQKKDCFCAECKKVNRNQHESLIWICPEKEYKLLDINIVFEKIKFVLQPKKRFFFILQKAHTLSLACANKLLKVLEEPPRGYSFILHTNNLHAILPTIKSRCHIVNFVIENQHYNFKHSLASFFYNQRLDNPIEFEKELKNQHLSPSESIQIANDMIIYFTQQILSFFRQNQIPSPQILYFEKVITFLKTKIKTPPQSGSSNLFWKDIYISFPRQT